MVSGKILEDERQKGSRDCFVRTPSFLAMTPSPSVIARATEWPEAISMGATPGRLSLRGAKRRGNLRALKCNCIAFPGVLSKRLLRQGFALPRNDGNGRSLQLTAQWLGVPKNHWVPSLFGPLRSVIARATQVARGNLR